MQEVRAPKTGQDKLSVSSLYLSDYAGEEELDIEIAHCFNEDIEFTPEKHMMGKLLALALSDIAKNSPAINVWKNSEKYNKFVEASQWVESRKQDFLSFEFICEQLNFSASAIRELILDENELKRLSSTLQSPRKIPAKPNK